MGSRFASMVRVGMRDSRVSLRELCRQAELDPSYLSKVLSGKRSPPAEEASLRKIATALSLLPAELVVAAGRVPTEWKRLKEDPATFASVHRLLTAGGGALASSARSSAATAATNAASAAESRWTRRVAARAPAKKMDDELL